MIKFSEDIYDLTYDNETNSYTFDGKSQKTTPTSPSNNNPDNKEINKSKPGSKNKNKLKGQIIDIYIF